jgi:membrane protease YdiL (CAAX protease family)
MSSLRAELRSFLAVARTGQRDVVVVLLAATLISVASYYAGSRVAFRALFLDALGGERLYGLYEYLYWFGSEFVLAFLVPVALVLLVHRAPASSFGLGAGDWRFGLKLTAVYLAVMLPLLWIASASTDFQAVYPHAQIAKTDWGLFALYEAGLVAYFVGWEYIWRGYVLFGLEPRLGPVAAVLVQTMPFVILHNGKPPAETLGAVLAGIALGALALRTRSFWYCVITHWTVMFTIDLFSTLRFRHGITGLFGS